MATFSNMSEDLGDVSNPNPSYFLTSNQESNVILTIGQATSQEPLDRVANQSLDFGSGPAAMVRPVVQEFQTTLCERPIVDAIAMFDRHSGVDSGDVASTVVSSGGQQLEEPRATSIEAEVGDQQAHTKIAIQVRHHCANSALHFLRGSGPSRLPLKSSSPSSSTKNVLLPNPITVSKSFSGPVCGITEHSVQSESGFEYFVCLVEEDGCKMRAMPIDGGE